MIGYLGFEGKTKQKEIIHSLASVEYRPKCYSAQSAIEFLNAWTIYIITCKRFTRIVINVRRVADRSPRELYAEITRLLMYTNASNCS